MLGPSLSIYLPLEVFLKLKTRFVFCFGVFNGVVFKGLLRLNRSCIVMSATNKLTEFDTYAGGGFIHAKSCNFSAGWDVLFFR